MPRISFDVSRDDGRKISAIVRDAVARSVIKRKEVLDIEMSLIACHANGCPLDLDKLAKFDDFNLGHDLFGIHRHIDKDDSSPKGGQLLDFFLPRAAKHNGRGS